jgi:hypothetical protein
MLTDPNEVIEDENTCNEAQDENHKVCVVLHADWSYDKWGEWQKSEELCGHTAIQHPRRMAGKSSSGNGPTNESNYFVHAHGFAIRDAFIAKGTVPGAWGF